MNKLLHTYIKTVQEIGAHNWNKRFEEEYGITINDMRVIAENEIDRLEEAAPFDNEHDKLVLALVGGIFLGLASMVQYHDDIDNFSKDLENYGKGPENEDSGDV